ncbi:dNTP triphosphohydrolase [Arthrobacter sp. AK01]|uniref:deoxyguanosinetriphosphate triphosphohydrolase family protein n=1 Tax=Arthrobacter sp. AK01 TaxID=2894084 RepID=UPI001E5D573D|nr:dNTP triphosphohydrolase [Arthrobacter sp. AK01]MCD4849690.1 dNTP triphosphohydrolase [Arthrobacter sp. AK01]
MTIGDPLGEELEKLPDGSLVVENQKTSRHNRRLAGSPGEHDLRTETEKDRGRINYSGFLRRLSGVTQVVSPDLGTPRLHSRESHSQKVGLVSREIAEQITRQAAVDADLAKVIKGFGGLDVSATEAAGLAHDLGHPPFGHVGEVVLNELLRRKGVADGFEGNAQSFRIVTRLDSRRIDALGTGLNLTAVTLAAILKYPFMCPPEQMLKGSDELKAASVPPKFGAYVSDKNEFERVMKHTASDVRGDRQSLEASIMDLADDITYAIHDLEDFHQEDAIDFDEVRADLRRAHKKLGETQLKDIDRADRNPFVQAALKLNEDYPEYFNKDRYVAKLTRTEDMLETGGLASRHSGSRLQASRIQSKMGVTIEEFFGAVRVSADPQWKGGPSVYLEPHAWHMMQCLKTITRRYVVDTPKIGLIQRAQRKVLTELFEGLCEWVGSEPMFAELPQPLADYLKDASPGASGKVPGTLSPDHFRAIADYICSLSDQECYARSSWIRGVEVPGLALAR